ncbi:MAG: ribosome recycling factor [Planctomycetes bacterium]|nr:ribosome recycling factor [Planctomycetota bacterium]
MDYDEILFDVEERMEKTIEVLTGEYRGMRTGRANPGLVENLRVEYYGSPTPLRQIANISAPEANLLVIKPYDPSSLGGIEKAIQKSEIGIQPQNDGKIIRLVIPPLSEERRKQLVARAKDVAEEARISARNIRREGNKGAEALEKDGAISEDDLEKLKGEIQKLTDKTVERIDAKFKEKSKELMEM